MFHVEQFLEKLFESVPKVRILRLFMQNPEHFFTFREITQHSRIKPSVAKTQLKKFIKVGLIKQKTGNIQKELKITQGKEQKTILKNQKAEFYGVDPKFGFIKELEDLVIKSSITSKKKLLKYIKNIGNVKLAVISGVFMKNSSASRTDLLIVGDNITRSKIENFLSKIESEIGKSIHYTLMDMDEFKYRINMYDRFLRDTLEYPHEKLINKIGV